MSKGNAQATEGALQRDSARTYRSVFRTHRLIPARSADGLGLGKTFMESPVEDERGRYADGKIQAACSAVSASLSDTGEPIRDKSCRSS